jgi:hypothetical protein
MSHLTYVLDPYSILPLNTCLPMSFNQPGALCTTCNTLVMPMQIDDTSGGSKYCHNLCTHCLIPKGLTIGHENYAGLSAKAQFKLVKVTPNDQPMSHCRHS